MDKYAFNEEVFGIIEPALEEAGYTILDGDSDTSCVCSPSGATHFQIKLIHAK